MNDPATAPTYVVAEQPFDQFDLDRDGAMRAIIARDYRLEATVAGIPIYHRISAGAVR